MTSIKYQYMQHNSLKNKEVPCYLQVMVWAAMLLWHYMQDSWLRRQSQLNKWEFWVKERFLWFFLVGGWLQPLVKCILINLYVIVRSPELGTKGSEGTAKAKQPSQVSPHFLTTYVFFLIFFTSVYRTECQRFTIQRSEDGTYFRKNPVCFMKIPSLGMFQ